MQSGVDWRINNMWQRKQMYIWWVGIIMRQPTMSQFINKSAYPKGTRCPASLLSHIFILLTGPYKSYPGQESQWATFIQDLPKEPLANPLTLNALTEAIVRIYVRQVCLTKGWTCSTYIRSFRDRYVCYMTTLSYSIYACDWTWM